MSLASSLKRVLAAAGIVVVALGAAVAVVPVMLPAEQVRAAVAAEMGERLGAPVTITGAVSVSVLPQLSVRLDGVRIGEGSEPQASAEAIIGTLRLLPLVAGSVSFSEYALVRPRIAVSVDREGRSNWDGSFARIRAQAGRPVGGLPDLRITEGVALIRDDKMASHVQLGGLDFAVSWPGRDRQANISGRFVYNGETVEVNAVVARPLALFTAEPTGVKMRIAAQPVRGAFEGRITNGQALTAEGAMTLESPSLRTFLRWIGQNPGIGPSLGAFALKGEVQMLPTSLAFTKVNAELDGNVADGALIFSFDGPRPQIRGTLDASRLVTTTYFRDLRLTPEDGRGWSRRPIDLSAIALTDVDVRISATEMIVGQAHFGRSAASIVAKGGRLTVTLGEAQAYGGLLSGTLTVSPQDNDVDVRAMLNVQRAQLDQGLGEWFGFRRLDGTANAHVAIEARGASMADLARTASGQASLTAAEGAVHGFNAEGVLRRLERRPLSAAGADARSGRTPYQRIAATVRIAGGVATTTDMVMDGQAVRVALRGVAQIPSRELDLRGVAVLKRTASQTAEATFELPFLVQGSWDDPFILPDPQSLIRRSGAAAPLRDATRDRDALRAVMDAINRHAAQEAESVPPPATSYNPYAPIGLRQ